MDTCRYCGEPMKEGAERCDICEIKKKDRATLAAVEYRKQLGIRDGFDFGIGFSLACTLVSVVLWGLYYLFFLRNS